MKPWAAVPFLQCVAACLPYLIPLMGCLAFGGEFEDRFPAMMPLLTALEPILFFYYGNSFTPFFAFFFIFLLIVRNLRVPHFIRYNAMMAILLDICIMCGGLLTEYLPWQVDISFLGTLITDVTFYMGVMTIGYILFHTIQGRYCDVPLVSEAVYLQVPAPNDPTLLDDEDKPPPP